MEKEYREMTPEERLKIIQAAMNADGFPELLKIVKGYEIILSTNQSPEYKDVTALHNGETTQLEETIKVEGLAGVVEKYKNSQNDISMSDTQELIAPQTASIYAEEHIPAVQEDYQEQNGINNAPAEEQHKVKVLEPERKILPNPWEDIKRVVPGDSQI